MALVLREDDVRATLTMPDTMRVVEAAFRRQGQSQTRNHPRARIVVPPGRGVLHTLPAYVPGEPGDPERDGPGLMGLKTYSAFATGVRFMVLLFSAADGQLLALIEADWLGQMRTGAASGVATRYLARPDAQVVAIIGAGGQARTQILAMATAQPQARFLVASRNAERLRAFCAEMSAATSLHVEPAESIEAATRAADIIVTATTSHEPVVFGSWLRPGVHINAMGSNWANRRELDDEAVERSAVVVVDALDQARIEAGDLLIPATRRRFDLDRAIELGAVVASGASARNTPDEITLFKSLGIGLEDVATAGLVYAIARERGLGHELDILP